MQNSLLQKDLVQQNFNRKWSFLEIQKKRFDLLKPIVEKAQKAVSDVASEKGFKYVMDSSPGKGLIVFEGEDLMPSVKTKLGIQ